MTKVYTKILPIEKISQYSFGQRVIKGITLHETGNELSALENIEAMIDSRYNYSANIFVDETGVYIVIPLEYSSMHTGKAKDKGNENTVSIEICRSKSLLDIYKISKDNAIQYTKHLLRKLNLGVDDIYFHNDFDGNFYCPHRILFDYGSKQEFIRRELLHDSNDGK